MPKTAFATAFWRRLDVSGSDAALLSQSANGYELTGQAVFLDPRGPTALQYHLDLAHDWSTREARINGFFGERAIVTHIVRSHTGWMLNGQDFKMAEVQDLDLGFSPATNMAQLRRIALPIGGNAKFDVVWLDTGADSLQRLPQEYTRISAGEYAYCSPTVDYRTTITLAPSGFVSIYPGLWKDQMDRD